VIAAGKRYQNARSEKTFLDRPLIRASANRSQPTIKRRYRKKEASFVLRVVKDPMFGSTDGENLVLEKRESIAESSSDRSIPSEMNWQH
jgi:hypothetical protein